MGIKSINPKLCLLLLFTLSLLLLPCHSYKRREQQGEEEKSAKEELFDCTSECKDHRREWDEQRLADCYDKCQDDFHQRKERERGSGDEIEEPWKVYQRCQRACDKKQGSTSQDQCRTTCREQYDEMKKHQPQERRGGADCGCGGYDCTCRREENHHHPIEEQRYKECQSRCRSQGQGQQRQLCEHRCKWQYEKQQGEHGDVANPRKEYERETESTNPYYFQKQRFNTKFRSEEGHIKVLPRFSKKSELLEGIDNYRLAVMEANPNTFVLPHHNDAETLFFVVGGKATLSFVRGNERQSFNLKQGDVTRVPAGSIVYLINNDNNEKLYVLKLLQPVNTPGKFKDYFGVGVENQESFYKTFSNEILEAAFNAPREKLERLFGEQRKGAIIKASKQQIKALSQQSESSSKGRRAQKWSPINVTNTDPLFSNKFGQYFEVSPKDHDQLKDLDVAVGFMKIKNGGMIAPYYNSRSTKLVLVVGGRGYFEMACPHLSSESRQSSEYVNYEKVRARLSVGDAFIVPAGHPFTMVATGDSDLQLASFGISASFNEKNFLAGKENIWEEVEKEAKALAFDIPAEEVEQIFRSQDQSYFLAGPGQQKERGKWHDGLASILEFGAF